MKLIIILHLVLVALTIPVLAGSPRNDSSKPVLRELSISGEYTNLLDDKPDANLDSFMKVLANVTPEFYKLLSKPQEAESQRIDIEKMERDVKNQTQEPPKEVKKSLKKYPKSFLRKSKRIPTTKTPTTTSIQPEENVDFEAVSKTELSPKIITSFIEFLSKKQPSNSTKRPHGKTKRDTSAAEFAAEPQMENAEDVLQQLYQRVETSKNKKVQLPGDKKSLVNALGQLVGDFEKLVGGEEPLVNTLPSEPREKKYVSFDIQVFSKSNDSAPNNNSTATNRRVRKSNSDAKTSVDKRQSDEEDDDQDDEETESPARERQKKDEEVVISNEVQANETDKTGETSIDIKDTIQMAGDEGKTTTTGVPMKKEIESVIAVMRNLSESFLHDLDVLSADTEKVMTTVPTTTVWIETSWDINVRINDSMLLKNGRKSDPNSDDPRSKERVKINGEVHENVSTKGKKPLPGAAKATPEVKKLKVKKLVQKARKNRENHGTEKGKRSKRYRHYH